MLDVPFFQHCQAMNTAIEIFCQPNTAITATQLNNAQGTLQDNNSRKDWKNEVGKDGFTALMACAISGNIENAIKLADQDQLGSVYTLSHVTRLGESAFFYALRENQWDFLRGYRDYFQAKQLATSTTDDSQTQQSPILEIHGNDSSSMDLIINRMFANDTLFFTNLLELGIIFDYRMLITKAIEFNQTWLIEMWPEKSINQIKALHSACYFGQIDCVSSLVDKNDAININELDSIDSSLENLSPLHICHLLADLNEFKQVSTAKNEGIISRIVKFVSSLSTPKSPPLASANNANIVIDINNINANQKYYPTKHRESLPEDYWEAYEFGLHQKRHQCFQKITSLKEISKQPDYLHLSKDGKTSYDRALQLHNFAMDKMKIPKLEIQERDSVGRTKILFQNTASVLEFYENIPEIMAMRNNFANTEFVKQIFLFFLFLIILTAVGVMGSTNSNDQTYQLNSAISNNFFDDTFTGISSPVDFWNWIDSNLLSSIVGDPPTIIQQNLVIGDIQLRQFKVRNNSCHIASLYDDIVNTCYASQFKTEYADKAPFGPNNIFQYQDNEGGKYWSNDDTWYPQGGFIETLSTSNISEALDVSASLQQDGWITEGTRLILASWTVYNPNLRGTFAIMTAEFQFTAVGDVIPMGDAIVLGPYAVDVDITNVKSFKYFLELVIALFVLYEFLFTEVKEIKESIQGELQNYRELKKNSRIQIVSRPLKAVVRGFAEYSSMGWNYYEWLIIIIFMILLVLRCRILVMWSELNLHPLGYSNFQSVGTLEAYYQDLFAAFLLLNWLRLLKFFRIPAWTGPQTQSIMDTLTAKTVIVFVFIIFYVVLVFSLGYYVAFGTDVEAYSLFGKTAMTMFQALFGNWDYVTLEDSNKIFGPLLFITFLIFVGLVLMNLLIGVLGEAYSTAQELNQKRWNRYITRLMINTIHKRCQPPETESRSLLEGTTEKLKQLLRLDYAFVESNEKPIYFNDQQLDAKLLTTKEEDEFQQLPESETPKLEDDTKIALDAEQDSRLDEYLDASSPLTVLQGIQQLLDFKTRYFLSDAQLDAMLRVEHQLHPDSKLPKSFAELVQLLKDKQQVEEDFSL